MIKTMTKVVTAIALMLALALTASAQGTSSVHGPKKKKAATAVKSTNKKNVATTATKASPVPIATGISTSKVVDLGLSVKWAGYNIGATYPEEAGNYYSWGEVEVKEKYVWYTTVLRNDDGDYMDVGRSITGTSYDVAHVKWGNSWHTPTLEEMKELVTRCKWQWSKYHNVKGYKVTGPNGKAIFLPATGDWYTKLENSNSEGTYHTSTRCDRYDRAYYLYFNNHKKRADSWGPRYGGHVVRAVCK